MEKECYEERRGGGYKQREKRRKLEAKTKLYQSSLAQYMVQTIPGTLFCREKDPAAGSAT